MYEEYWGLKEKPFQNSLDARFFYLSPQHEDALMKLTYVVAQNLGAGMLTGVFGCGKTFLARFIANDLGRQKFCFAFINNPVCLHPAELLRAIVRSFSPQMLPERKTELLVDPLLEKLYNTILDNVREGKENVVVIDEAHIIEDPQVFEQLRLILNFQDEGRFLLTLLILGQPELKAKIDALKPLAQRIPIRCQLGPLSEEDTSNYLEHRLKIAGGTTFPEKVSSLLDKEVVKMIFKISGGIPRKINTLCDLILLSGFAKKISRIDVDFVNSVVEEFRIS